jgi:hypothetical protein
MALPGPVTSGTDVVETSRTHGVLLEKNGAASVLGGQAGRLGLFGTGAKIFFLHFSFFFFKNIWFQKNLQNYTSGAVEDGVKRRAVL